MKRYLAALLAVAFTLVSAAAAAQTQQRIRGTITALDGNVLSIKSREGKDLKIELTEKASVATARATTLADLKQGTYVGVTTTKRADGALVAVEVHTLAPTVKPGYMAWDLQPGAMMTNANIAAVVESGNGHELAVDYKEGSQKIIVPAGTPIVTTVNADRSALKPGEYVYLNADVAADGKMTMSGRIQVSKDGVRPPQ